MLSKVLSNFAKASSRIAPLTTKLYHTDSCDVEAPLYCNCNCGCVACLCGPPKTFIGRKAPDFTADAVLEKGAFGEVSLEDYEGKWLCLNFYPLDFTFVCPTEILAFNDRIAEFQELDCEVLMTSIDSKFSHLAWTQLPRNEGGLGAMQVPLVSDITKTMSRDYGVLNSDAGGIAFRGTFLIDPESTLRQIIINDLPIGRNVDEVLRLLEACQYFDENGEVCPVGWNKGDDTIDPANPDEFFSKQ